MPVDKRGILDDEVFSYRVTKNKKVFISYHGKKVTTLSGSKAEKFIAEIEGADGKESQLVMARVTGNFKRGNEKNKQKERLENDQERTNRPLPCLPGGVRGLSI